MEKQSVNTIIKSITGGFLIGLGGTVFLSVDNRIVGSFLFSLGLLAICATKQLLFTGKISYKNKVPFLLIILLSNYIGASAFGICIHYLKPDLAEKALVICQNKISEGFLVIPLGIFCNILIYFAVEGFSKGHGILLILCVMAFILCGFEHCIANIFYFSVAGIMPIYYILLNIIGNTIGGLMVRFIRYKTLEE